MRSFRIPLNIDARLSKAARQRKWSKSFLIRDIIESWLAYHAIGRPQAEGGGRLTETENKEA